MKLSPPASSSDLDAAREVARRLNHVATPAEPARPLPDFVPAKGALDHLLVPPPQPAPPAWERAPVPVTPSAPAERPDPPPTIAKTPAPPPPPQPSPSETAPAGLADEALGVAPEIRDIPPGPVVEPGPAPKPPVDVVAPPLPSPPPPSPPPAPLPPPSAAPPPAPAAAPPLPEPPQPVAAEPPAARVEEVEEIEEDLVPDEPTAAIGAAVAAPITWAEIVATCLALAEAKGALVINPGGRVVAVSGDWPSPGAEAIASRLVPAMDKALKDAPTRSVSVPLGGVHLTAWRAPMAHGLVTVGFLAEAPLRPDLRPAIDAIVRKGSEV